jgi:hypothetical protein
MAAFANFFVRIEQLPWVFYPWDPHLHIFGHVPCKYGLGKRECK